MRTCLITLTALAASLTVSAPASAADDEWKIQTDSCLGMYGMLVENKESIDLLLPKAAGIDYAARRDRLAAQATAEEKEMAEIYKGAFSLNYLKARVDADKDGLFNVLKVAIFCDGKFGYAPSLGG